MSSSDSSSPSMMYLFFFSSHLMAEAGLPVYAFFLVSMLNNPFIIPTNLLLPRPRNEAYCYWPGKLGVGRALTGSTVSGYLTFFSSGY